MIAMLVGFLLCGNLEFVALICWTLSAKVIANVLGTLSADSYVSGLSSLLETLSAVK